MTEQREELLSASSRLPIRAIWVRWRRCSPKTWCCTVTAVVRCPPWHGRRAVAAASRARCWPGRAEACGSVERWWHQVQVNGQPGALLLDGTGKLIGVRALDIAAGQVQAVSAIVNPDKLRHIGPIGDLQGVLERKERV
jgi:hypothetical protein